MANDADPAGLSFEDNLFAKVEDGEWTYEEGLTATLGAIAGEVDEAAVLRTSDLASREATGILQMAREYMDEGSDPDTREKLRRLLDSLRFTPDQLEAMAIPASASSGAQRISLLTQTPEQDCDRFFGGRMQPDEHRRGETVRRAAVLERRRVDETHCEPTSSESCFDRHEVGYRSRGKVGNSRSA